MTTTTHQYSENFNDTRRAPVLPKSGQLNPVLIDQVRLLDGFWGSRQEVNLTGTIPHAAGWMRRLGWVQNFIDAASGEPFERRGIFFADSEVYKLIEAMSWELGRGSREVEPLLDEFIDAVLPAQEPDGYLHTLFGHEGQKPRYSNLESGHEMYCFGHFIQAAIAHHRVTGQPQLLDAAVRLADHVCREFGPEGRQAICGHPEIEMALLELWRETGAVIYLEQARIFVDRRGHGTLGLSEFGAQYWQDEMPFRDATVLRGHAVRALYLASAAVDIAVESDDSELLASVERQWQQTVSRRTYVTGGMGSHHMDEAFGDDFVLPADRSYCETCAGVASIMLSWRLLLATGDTKYADLIERTLYNVVATCANPEGTAFFYANTLHQRVAQSAPAMGVDGVAIRGGASGRQPWFEASCCPPNLARMMASLGGYMATTSGAGVQLHQYAAGTFHFDVLGDEVQLVVDTVYPADGRIEIRVTHAPASGFDLTLRVPAWATGSNVARDGDAQFVETGSVLLTEVKAGELVVLNLTLETRVTVPDARIDAVRGSVAVERGPEVYCLESVDLPVEWSLDNIRFMETTESADGRVQALITHNTDVDPEWPYGSSAVSDLEGPRLATMTRYHEWAQRGPSTMRVWIPVNHVDAD